jgi:peptide deformylase
MALLPILCYPDPKLHTVAKPVTRFDEALKTTIANMFETMYEAKGIGLAATQVDFHERLIVLDVSEEKNKPLVVINPTIVSSSAEHIVGEEGCLSVPGIYDEVERAQTVEIAYLDENGQSQRLVAHDLLAVCIQHEMDHLMGRVFVEYLSPLKRNRIKTKMIKAQREASRT